MLTKTFLFKSYCLPLYGCSLWSLGSPSIKTIDVALNKILRKVWKLPTRSHTGVVHCIAHVSTISNILFQSFHFLLSKASSSSSTLIRTIFRDSTFNPFSFAGYNFCCGHHHLREYTTAEINKGLLIRSVALVSLLLASSQRVNRTSREFDQHTHCFSVSNSILHISRAYLYTNTKNAIMT